MLIWRGPLRWCNLALALVCGAMPTLGLRHGAWELVVKLDADLGAERADLAALERDARVVLPQLLLGVLGVPLWWAWRAVDYASLSALRPVVGLGAGPSDPLGHG